MERVSHSHDIYVLVAHLLARGPAYVVSAAGLTQNNVHTGVAYQGGSQGPQSRDVGVQILHEHYYTLNIHQGHTLE